MFNWFNGNILWGILMLFVFFVIGFYFMFGFRVINFCKIFYVFLFLFKGCKFIESGDIFFFNVLMIVMFVIVGIGNIVGVVMVIVLGGFGVLFWMWCIVLVGMVIKYGEVLLVVKFREIDECGFYVGGFMYYIKNGLGVNWVWFGILFVIFGMFVGFGIGNIV